MEEAGDDELMRAVVREQPEALRELYRRHSPSVYGLALHFVGDSDAAEVCQDVFLRLWSKAGSYSASRSSLRTWLLAITRHRCIDVLRRRFRGRFSPVELDTLPSSVPEPGELLTDSEETRAVVRALAALSPSHREVLELAFHRGLSHSRVAEALGAPLGTVKSRIREALRRLRERLQP